MSGGACAACKYQRRKCAPDCPLAPFFPPDRPTQFLNAHRLFGVGNILKVIKDLSPLDREIAMKSIIFQANARATDPVGGCYRIICDLHRQIQFTRAELQLVLGQLDICRNQAARGGPQMPAVPPNRVAVANVSADRRVHYPAQPFELTGYGEPQQENYAVVENYHSQAHSAARIDEASSSCQFVDDESEDMKPFLDIFDDKQPVETIQLCSDKGKVKEDVELVHQGKREREQDLKGTASPPFFSHK